MKTDPCPWCKVPSKWRPDGEGSILEWKCGSYSSNSRTHQSDRCTVAVLQDKVERLQAIVAKQKEVLLRIAKTKNGHCDYTCYGHMETVRLAREAAEAGGDRDD